MKLFTLLFLLLCSAPASADIIVQSITNASRTKNFNPNSTTNTSIQVFGGLGGGATQGACATKNNSSTCNSCDGTATACNENRVHDDLPLTFRISSTKVKIGTPAVTMQSGSAVETPVPLVNSPALTTDTNQLATAQVTWKQLIDTMDAVGNVNANSRCTTPCVQTIRVGLDAAGGGLTGSDDDSITMTLIVFDPGSAFNTMDVSCSKGGFCNYSLFPGDSKAYLENVDLRSINGGRNVAAIIFICSEGPDTPIDFSSVVIPSYIPGLKRVSVTGTSPTEDNIEGFSNLIRYYCRASTEDDTGNILLHHDGATDLTCPAAYQGTECHTVKPDEVIGLFKEKQNCFIATAAFGSPWMDQVKTLRRFRSDFLAKFSLGRSFIRFYYNNAPPLAGWIAENETRRTVTRVLLTPLFGIAYLSVNWPMATLSFLIGLSFIFAYRRFNRMGTR